MNAIRIIDQSRAFLTLRIVDNGLLRGWGVVCAPAARKIAAAGDFDDKNS